jgi:hypothetical protein
MELRPRVSEEQLMANVANGSAAHLQSQMVIEHQRQKIGDMETQIWVLEMEIVMWKTRFTTAQ